MQHADLQSQIPVSRADLKTAHDTLTDGDSNLTEDPHIPDKTQHDTLTDGDGDATEDPEIPDSTVVELPPGSFWLSKDAEFDWFDRNAFLDRKDSTKGNYNNSTNLNHIVNPSHSNSSSQRYNINSVNTKSKAAIIGLPKTQKTTYVRNCKPVNVRLFPTRSYSVGKVSANVPVMEPTSPKVSCIGRVRSKRCRSRRKKAGVVAIEPVKSASQRSGTGRVRKGGLLSRITKLFRSDGRSKKDKTTSEKVKVEKESSVQLKICVSVKPVNSEPATPSGPPGLGAVIRFASGHRSGNWGGLEEYDVAGRHSLDSGVTASM